MVDNFDRQFATFSQEGGRTPTSNPGGRGSNLVQKKRVMGSVGQNSKPVQYRTASEATPVLAASNFDSVRPTSTNSSDRKKSVLGGLFNK